MMYFLSLLFNLGVVWAQVLLQVQERDLRVRRWLKKITELVVKNKNATVVWVLETLFSNVRVNRAGNEAAGDELVGFDTEKLSELWGDGLFAVEAVVLRTRGSFGSVWVVLLGLDLTNDLGQGLDVVAEAAISVRTVSRDILLCLT